MSAPGAATTAPFPPVDFEGFHRSHIPELLDSNVALAGPDVAGVDPIAFRVGDDAFTYVPEAGGVRVVAGDDEAATLLALDAAAWTDFVHELRTSFGLMIGELVEFPRGDFGHLVRWEPALRAIWHGRAIYDDEAVEAVAGLDLETSFAADAPFEEMRAFFDRAGFLHVRDVFTHDEMAALGDEAERIRSEARLDDGASWWAKTRDGHDVCCRVIYSGRSSERVRKIAADPRVVALTGLLDTDLYLCDDRLDGEPLLFKHPDVVEGLSDLPWHRDCGMGGHPVLCPSLKFGIQIDPATPDSGQLTYLAGSHRHSNHPPREQDLDRLPTRTVTTARGDLTLHMAHVLHAAPPPGGAHGGRRTLYVNYEQPLVWQVVEPGHGYNDSVLARRGRVAF